MTTTARLFADRALAWATDQPVIRAVVIFGSVARGEDNDFSDLDLILVTEPGRRGELWERRAEIAGTILGAEPSYLQEPSWQGDFRYQAWDAGAHELDLTIAEERVDVFGGIVRGFQVLLDRANVEEELTTAVDEWAPPEFDAAALDGGTWVWLLWLQGRLRHGERFAVRAGVVDTLMGRVVPMLDGEWHSAHSQLASADLERVHAAMPRSDNPTELARSLRDTAALYDEALDRWAARTGKERPVSPLAAVAKARLQATL